VVLILFGPPGSGKGTQSEFLRDHFKIPQVATGDLFRGETRAGTELGRKAKEYMDRLEADTLAEQEKIAAEYDSQIDKLRYDIQGQRQKVLDESLAEIASEQFPGERLVVFRNPAGAAPSWSCCRWWPARSPHRSVQ